MSFLLLFYIIGMCYMFLARISTSECSLVYDIKEVHDIVIGGVTLKCIRC